MIEERGRVLSVEEGAVWVETLRRSACDSCQARNGCGQSVLQRLGLGARSGFIRVLNQQVEHRYRVGDEVIIGVPEHAVLHGSVMVYLIPLLMLFAGALLAQSFGASEGVIIAAGFSGMAGGFAGVRWHGRRLDRYSALLPRVLGRVPEGSNVFGAIQERSRC